MASNPNKGAPPSVALSADDALTPRGLHEIATTAARAALERRDQVAYGQLSGLEALLGEAKQRALEIERVMCGPSSDALKRIVKAL